MLKSGIATLSVDEKSLFTLDELGIGECCPEIETLTLEFRKTVSLDAVSLASSLFPDLTQLGIAGPRDHLVSLDNVKSFCKNLTSSFAHLATMQFTNVRLGNDTVVEIVGYLRRQDCLPRIL